MTILIHSSSSYRGHSGREEMLGQPLGESLWKVSETHAIWACTFIKWSTHFFPSLYYRHDTITRFINSLLQGLKISQCDGLMHIALALTSGALNPPTSRNELKHNATTSLCFNAMQVTSLPPFFPLPWSFPFPDSLKHSTGISKHEKQENVWFTTSFYLYMHFSFHFHISYWSHDEWGEMDYLFSSQSFKSLEKH